MLEKYAPQVATHRRSTTAIVQGAKELIALVGLNKMSMIEIADISEVSRATLYNHYRDKESVLRALAESEMARLIAIAQSATTTTDALEALSIQISTDPALASMRLRDQSILTTILSAQSDSVWNQFHNALAEVLSDHNTASLAIRWLIGQALAPLTPTQSRLQAEALTTRANI